MTGHRIYGTFFWPSVTSAEAPWLSLLFGRILMSDAHQQVSGRVLEPAAAEVTWQGSVSSSVTWLPSPAQNR